MVLCAKACSSVYKVGVTSDNLASHLVLGHLPSNNTKYSEAVDFFFFLVAILVQSSFIEGK